MVTIDNRVTFHTGNGGHIRMVDSSDDLERTGLDGSYAFYDDLYVDPTVPMTLDISDGYDVQGELTQLTGEPVLTFDLTSREPNGVADLKFTNLAADTWYRLQFDGALAKTATGRAHAQTSKTGVLEFTRVEIPNE